MRFFLRIYARFDNVSYMLSDVKLSLICRPISSPVLSGRARRETPKLGSTNDRASIPRTNSTLTTFLGLTTLPVQSVEDLPVPPVDDVLCVFR